MEETESTREVFSTYSTFFNVFGEKDHLKTKKLSSCSFKQSIVDAHRVEGGKVIKLCT